MKKGPEKKKVKRSSACAALCGILLAAVLAGTGCSQAQTTPADQNRAGKTAASGKTAAGIAAETASTGKTAGETAAETAATGETASETAAIGETAGEEFSKPGEEKDYKGVADKSQGELWDQRGGFGSSGVSADSGNQSETAG